MAQNLLAMPHWSVRVTRSSHLNAHCLCSAILFDTISVQRYFAPAKHTVYLKQCCERGVSLRLVTYFLIKHVEGSPVSPGSNLEVEQASSSAAKLCALLLRGKQRSHGINGMNPTRRTPCGLPLASGGVVLAATSVVSFAVLLVPLVLRATIVVALVTRLFILHTAWLCCVHMDVALFRPA